jgi:hypothetical protein
LDGASGKHKVFLVFKKGGSNAMFNINWLKFDSAKSIPDAPSGLTASGLSTSEIKVEWDDSTGASGYDLMVNGVLVSNVSSPYSNTGLAGNSIYTYRIRAKNCSGSSEWSSTANAITKSIDIA